MERCTQSSGQQAFWKDVEVGKENQPRFRRYRLGAVVLGLVFLMLTFCIFSLRFIWSPSPTKVYDHQYKAVLDGMETDGVMEIDPAHRVEIFRMGNSSDEVLEVHDFENGLTGIRFSKHQRCYIRSQTKELPRLEDAEVEDAGVVVEEMEKVDVHLEDTVLWVPSEEPITDPAFLLKSKIWEVCQELPIHWIHPSLFRDADFHDGEDETDADARGQRKVRDVLDHLPVNDYREIGLELDNSLDEQGYCCQYCRRGYRYCQRYHEPLGGYWPYPYYYQGGRVICQIVMPCNWWIARMLGRV
ncbi:tenomodulin-like isoform X2 [Denticeps clupeoides]|uniref:tenomodulin-like isoform X2 n=1 Tax=Denticeps clupeoides TaxID=299321 RepID=UPI0010A2F8D1|nr:tenomodulin-like isoform X2 [Denticeps clupeoides]